MVSKYCDHLPLYRQARILEREAGVEIGRATLDGWVMCVGELLQPVIRRDAERPAERIVSASRRNHGPGADAGWARQQSRSLFMAVWQTGGGETVFDLCLGRGREGPRKFLDKWQGILQTDGYQAYEGVGGPKMVHVGCWAHYLDSGIIKSDSMEGAQNRVNRLWAS